MKRWATKQAGFTIVELLIVVVVIAILAAITIVAYTGIQNRAKDSSLKSTSAQAAKKLMTVAVQNNDSYPVDKSDFLAKTSTSESQSLEYIYLVTDSLKDFCLSVDNPSSADNAYATTSSVINPVPGTCIKNFIVNPSVESNLTGWTNRKTAVVTRTTSQQHTGTASISVVTPGTESDEGVNLAVSSNAVPVGVAGNYTGSAWVKGTSGVVVRIFVEEYTGGGTYVSGAASNLTLNGSWQRVSATKLISADTSKVAVNVRTLSATATTFYVDDVMVNAGSRAYQYGDGSTLGWSWSGVPDNSYSIGPSN